MFGTPGRLQQWGARRDHHHHAAGALASAWRRPRRAPGADPGLLIYVLSFTFIGICWNNHHHLLRATRRISGGAMWANLQLLVWLSLVPAVTAWVGARHSEQWARRHLQRDWLPDADPAQREPRYPYKRAAAA